MTNPLSITSEKFARIPGTAFMNKTIMYRVFGFGKIPKDAVSQFNIEGIVLSEEGIGGSITYRNFRAPGRYSGWNRSWFSGSLVLTRKHLLAFRYSKPAIGLAWDDERIRQLDFSLIGADKLSIRYEASTFNEDWSGNIELRYCFPRARTFLEKINLSIN